MSSNSQGGGGQYKSKIVHTYAGTRDNPAKKSEDDDWWEELCKKHQAKNHWKKKPKK